MSVKVSVIGASGRMGQLALSLIEKASDLELHSALTSKNALSESLGADLLLDLTKPEASEAIVDFAILNEIPIVVGTSGWTKEKIERVGNRLSANSVPVAIIPNFSIGSVLATKFAAEASKFFDGIEIIETHHTKKLDAPSGTALYTSQAISEARSGRGVDDALSNSSAPRFNGIPIKSVRIDGKHAEQEVFFNAPNEQLYLRHEVTSHEVYGPGVLLALRKTVNSKGLIVGLLPLLEESN